MSKDHISARATSQSEVTARFGPIWFRYVMKPDFILATLCLVSFLVQVQKFIGSDIGYLATIWIKDDSFYYLQPAWMFKLLGTFTFDGEHVTYGFQPLWMLLMVGTSFLTTDKVTFVRLSLIMGSVFYCATGFLLYRLSRLWLDNWTTLIIPTIWLINPGLILIYTGAKENALYAFLLIALVTFSYKILHWQKEIESASLDKDGYKDTSNIIDKRYNIQAIKKRALYYYGLYGAISGLMILSRVNSTIFVIMLVFSMLLCMKIDIWDKAKFLFFFSCGVCAILIPWVLYAESAFGIIFPNSGSQKLIAAQAALAIYLNQHFPWLRLEWLANLLAPDERLFLKAPTTLTLPSITLIIRFSTRFVPGTSVGFWRELLVLAFVTLAYAIIRRWIRQTPQSDWGLNRLLRFALINIPLVTFILWSLVNIVLNGFLFPFYLYYASWYAVPETVCCVLLAGYLLLMAVRSIYINNYVVLLCALLLGIQLYRFQQEFVPQQFTPSSTAGQIWEAEPWIKQHIPIGTRVGAWSSGLLGYFTDDPTIINLDGLANTPEYVNDVFRNYALFIRGLTPENRMWSYIQANNIRYIADTEIDSHIGRRPFWDTIPIQNYEVVYTGSLIHPEEPDGPRRFVIIKLRY